MLHTSTTLLLLGIVAVAAIAPAAKPLAATPPRFSAASVGSSGGGGAGGASDSESAGSAQSGGEWWVKDPPWFLPPPPEWGPMPPTMYTSYFHKPRYPALSTANYYPLYSREDEYDAHLPASMSRRAAYTQQQIYDHYVATYRAHTDGGAGGAGIDPNHGVSNPMLTGSANFPNLGEAHGRALHMQSPNNYFPLFTQSGPASPNHYTSMGGGFGFLETDGRVERIAPSLKPERSVSYFTASAQPTFIESAASSHTDSEDDSEDDSEETSEIDSDESVESEHTPTTKHKRGPKYMPLGSVVTERLHSMIGRVVVVPEYAAAEVKPTASHLGVWHPAKIVPGTVAPAFIESENDTEDESESDESESDE